MGDPMDRHWHPLLIAVLLLTAVAAGCTKSTTSRTAAPSASNPASTTAAGASRSAPPWVVGVTLKEFALTPTVTIAHAGPVTFDARNLGKIKHELVVLRTDRPAAALPVANGQASEVGKIGEIEQFPLVASRRPRSRLRPGTTCCCATWAGTTNKGCTLA